MANGGDRDGFIDSLTDRLLVQVGPDSQWVQGSPVLPGVWRAFVAEPRATLDLIASPRRGSLPGALASAIRKELVDSEDTKALLAAGVAHNQSSVALRADLQQLVQQLVPMTDWFERNVKPHLATIRRLAGQKRGKQRSGLLAELADPAAVSGVLPPNVVWWLRVTGSVALSGEKDWPDAKEILDAAKALLPRGSGAQKGPRLHHISLNRPVRAAADEPTAMESVMTIKADAAHRVFEADTSRITWAIADSGIDAAHPAFKVPGSRSRNRSRVLLTLDFTRVRELIILGSAPGDDAETRLMNDFGVTRDQARQLRASLENGTEIEWDRLRPALLVAPPESEGLTRTERSKRTRELKKYAEKLDPHGTHVAGVLGGQPAKDVDPIESGGDFVGVCPNINLVDVRILDAQGSSGTRRSGDKEFGVLAALQFIQHWNSSGNQPKIHGVNLSIQLMHDPKEYACGSTPVCEECSRLVANGVVVVAAAGNKGIDTATRAATTYEGSFRAISIADPGNAEAVITVGSTHRKRPHEYGVSFFSSRGPTGDGRRKPDLVAPGEKILGPVPAEAYGQKSGTSQAAPHVSGAAAILLARHQELIGEPLRVKQILCDTATDLGRERDFQGAGLVDVLRALQSV